MPQADSSAELAQLTVEIAEKEALLQRLRAEEAIAVELEERLSSQVADAERRIQVRPGCCPLGNSCQILQVLTS